MNNLNLTVQGKQQFMGKEIPVVLGGFGESCKVVTDKMVAEIHCMKTPHVRENINKNIKRFKENVDLIDLKKVIGDTDNNFLMSLGYTNMEISKAQNIYILSERGYAKLIKIMDTDLAWEIHDQLIDEYFHMKEVGSMFNNLSPQLQTLIHIEMEQNRMKEQIIEVKSDVQGIRDIVAINTSDWRKDTTNILNKIAKKCGGYDSYQKIRQESYEILEARGKCKLSTRLTNMKREMLENGQSKSKVDKASKLDVIDRDTRLLEIYTAIVKEMAIKYNVGMESA